MLIFGLQKLTLLDYPEHVACTVFLGGCDLRCPFCHNYELADGTAQPVMEEDAFFSFLSRRTGLLDGVAVTGGEPCLQPELPAFLARIRDMGYMVKLDTNGFHPDMLKKILDARLADYVAMDVKNSPAKYARTVGRAELDLSPVLRSIALIRESAPDYEFRTTVVRELHTADDIHEIGRMLQSAKRYFLQPFTDRDTVPHAGFHAPSLQEMNEYLGIAGVYIPNALLRGIDSKSDL